MSDQPGQDPGSVPPDPNVPPAPSPTPAGTGDYTAPPPPVPGYGTPPVTPPPGSPPPSNYGMPPQAPGYSAMPPAGYGAAPEMNLPFAPWGVRVLSALIDWFIPFLLADIFYVVSRPLGFIVWLAALAWAVYNAVLGGQTGQSYGKKTAGTKLVSATTGQPIGGGMGVVRAIAHIIDGIPCLLGYLWPLWDAKRQTFSDKIIGTYVVKV